MYLNINSKCSKISVSVDVQGQNNACIFNGMGPLTPTSNANCPDDLENMLISFMIIFGFAIFFVFICCCYCCRRNRRAKYDQPMMYSEQQNHEKIIDTHVQ